MKKFNIFLGLMLLLVFSFVSIVSAETTIKIAHFYDPMAGGANTDNYNWFQQVISDFEEANPGIRVEPEIFKWDQIDVKAMADYRAGIKDHDVFLTSPQLMSQHKLVGDLVDLSPYISNWSDEKMDQFSWSATWGKTKIGNEYLGLPLGAHTRLLLYNREMFKEVGLDPDRPPTNLNELVEYAKKLTRDTDGDGKIDVWGLGIYLGPDRATMELSFAPLIWHFGGKLWNPETKKATFASEEGIKAAKTLCDWVNKYEITPKFAVSGSHDDVQLKNAMDGNYAMVWGWGSYWISQLEDKGWVEGVFPPTPDGKAVVTDVALTPTQPQAQFTNAWFISIYKLSQNKDAAWKFVDFLLNSENLKEYPDAGLPARANIWNVPEYQTPFYKTWKEAISKGRTMPPTAHYGELADTVAAALQQILVIDEGANIAKTLQKAQDEYNARYGGE